MVAIKTAALWLLASALFAVDVGASPISRARKDKSGSMPLVISSYSSVGIANVRRNSKIADPSSSSSGRLPVSDDDSNNNNNSNVAVESPRVDSKAKKQEEKESTPEATPTAAELQMTQAVEPSNAADTVRSTNTAVEQSQANLEAASSMPQVEADSPSASQDQAAMQDAPVEAAAAADDDEKILATGVAPSESVVAAAADPEASVSDTTEAALEVARDAPEEVATLPPDELIEEDRSFKHAPIERFNVDLETQRKFVSAVRQDVVSSRAHSEDEADEPLDNEDDSRENVRSQREDKKSDDKKDKIKSKDKDKMEKLDKVEKVDKVKETKSKYKKPANDDPVQEYEEPTKDKRSPTDVDVGQNLNSDSCSIEIIINATSENNPICSIDVLLFPVLKNCCYRRKKKRT